jgi:hypothetical protein
MEPCSASKSQLPVSDTDKSPVATLMQRTWLDNALIIEGTKLLTLARQISLPDPEFTNSIKVLSNDQCLKAAIQREWENKSLALEELISVLQEVSGQLREERQLLWRR